LGYPITITQLPFATAVHVPIITGMVADVQKEVAIRPLVGTRSIRSGIVVVYCKRILLYKEFLLEVANHKQYSIFYPIFTLAKV
jgi:hypothetical protein